MRIETRSLWSVTATMDFPTMYSLNHSNAEGRARASSICAYLHSTGVRALEANTTGLQVLCSCFCSSTPPKPNDEVGIIESEYWCFFEALFYLLKCLLLGWSPAALVVLLHKISDRFSLVSQMNLELAQVVYHLRNTNFMDILGYW